MKKENRIGLLLMFLAFSLPLLAVDIRFDDYFNDETMRVDYFHIAEKITAPEYFTIDKIYRQGRWAGSLNSLIDDFNNGLYYIKIYDEGSGVLIYSKGFTSYCSEYMTTDAAAAGIKRTYHETALIPFPKKKITFTLERRNRENKLNRVFSRVIDPESVAIEFGSLIEGVTVIEAVKSGDPHKKADLAFIADGYTREEEGKFKQDVKRLAAVLLSYEPYKSFKKDINIYGVFKASQQSGSDEPRRGVFNHTAVGTSFNALGLRRYMLTEENRALHDIAAHAPYDTLLIMVNTERFGGGGIYNAYCCFSADKRWSNYLMVHEFGHSFAGLGDEYYTSTVSYNDFYPRGIEPTDPNLTALLDPENLKWKHLVKEGTPIPTPWGKEEYEKHLKKGEYLNENAAKFKGVVGAFEGAGYTAKGLYRPMFDCIMFSRSEIPFCTVCEDAISRMIKYYTK